MEPRETYLLSRIAQHADQEAYQELYYAHFASLHRFAAELVKSEVLAEELVSDVFIHLWKGRDGLTGIRNLRVYLFVATKNLCIRHLTRNGIKADFGDEFLEDLSAVSQSPHELLVSEELLNSLEKIVQELPERCRLIFKLVREEGMKYREVSVVLNISIKTIEAQMAIATKKILKSLPDFLLKLPSNKKI